MQDVSCCIGSVLCFKLNGVQDEYDATTSHSERLRPGDEEEREASE